jgi:hypothetical protein
MGTPRSADHAAQTGRLRLNRRAEFNSPLAQTTLNGTTSRWSDAKVLRKRLTMPAEMVNV